MIYLLLNYLKNELGVRVPAVFLYTSTRMILAALTTLVLCIFLGPWFIRKLYALKIGQSIRKEECPHLGKLHEKKENTPTMGGVLLLTAMLVALLLFMDLTHLFTWLLFLTTVVFGALGGVDDYFKLRWKSPKGLSARRKFLVEGVFSLLLASLLIVPGFYERLPGKVPVVKEQHTHKVMERGSVKRVVTQKELSLNEYATRVYVPFLKGSVGTLSAVLALVFIAFVITGTSNAVNLTDGLDGLAAGCLIMVAIPFGLIAFLSNNIDMAAYLNILYIEGSGEVAIYLSAFVGACLGFLWYNGHPAQLFMGDTGSLALGGVLGLSAVLLRRELLLAVVAAIFVMETLSVIIQVASFRMRKKRVFLCSPLHHHFEYKGWPETKVVLRFWIIGFLLAIIGIASIKFQ